MIIKAYDEKAVRNLQLQNAAKEMLDEKQITPPQYQGILAAFPVPFRTINPIMRIGLFLFTTLCIIFTIGLIAWFVGSSLNEKSIGGLLLILAIALTILNEVLIKSNDWYRHGSDNALSYASVICLGIGIAFITNIDNSFALSLLFFILLSLFAWRYGDALLAFGAFYASILTLFSLSDSANINPLTAFFGMAVISISSYFFAKNSLKNEHLYYWEDCFRVLEIVSLIGLYLSLNYLFVDDFRKGIYYDAENPETRMPLATFFAITTAVLPFIYLYFGIKNRDRILWILAVLGFVASILTYRHYFAVMPLEWALTLGGLVALGLAFFLISYLKQPRKGISYEPHRSKSNIIETLIVNQFLHADNAKNEGTQFGGGDFGGAGASDEY